MKLLLSLLAITGLVTATSAQWTNTTNHFYDSLHMRVTDSLGRPGRIEIIKSKPDGAYILVWDDQRGWGDIWAQKVSVDGQFLWPVGGIPAADGDEGQHMTLEQPDFDINRTNTCTDGAGGFYVTWPESYTLDHITSHNRIRVQHVRADGTRVFPNGGAIVVDYSGTGTDEYYRPQMVTDDDGGFYLGYARGLEQVAIIIRRMKDISGEIKDFGGGTVSNFASPYTVPTACGTKQLLDTVLNIPQTFRLYPDLQGGCNVVISASRYETGQNLAATYFNRLVRVKKNSLVTVRRRMNDSPTPVTSTTFYPKDSVVVLHSLRTWFQVNDCQGSPDTSWFLQNGGQGVLEIDGPTPRNSNGKGVIIPGPGNINFDAIAWNRTTSLFGTVPANTRTYVRFLPSEIYDSLPYQLCSDTTHPDYAFRPVPPDGVILDTLDETTDTIFRKAPYEDYVFGMMATGNRLLFDARIPDVKQAEIPGATPLLRSIYLQEFNVRQTAPRRFTAGLATTEPDGVLISRERGGFTFQEADTSIQYYPRIVGDSAGNAMLLLMEAYRYLRVSPIGSNVRLRWGATGRPLGTGIVKDWMFQTGLGNSYMEDDGKAIIVFEDGRPQELYSNWNMYMRHLDSLDQTDYMPPQRKATLLQQGESTAVPAFLAGSSHAWTTIETREYHGYNVPPSGSTPVIEIFDNRYLAEVQIRNYQHKGPVRTYNSTPYLNRSWSVEVGNQPAAGDSVDLRLIFTNAEFDSLRKADPAIHTPANLEIVKQPGTTGVVPASYSPVDGEVRVPVRAWAKIDSGYYVQIRVGGFSNFFIRQDPETVLPVNWLGINAERLNPSEVRVTWEVSQEENVKEYIVQSSPDGRIFTNQCRVASSNRDEYSRYSCMTAATDEVSRYFRVRQLDFDGRSSYSNTVLVKPASDAGNLLVGPNPSTGVSYLRYTSAAGVRGAVLVNASGMVVWRSGGNLPSEGSMAIPMQRLTAGIYILEVESNSGKQTFRIIRK